MSTCSAPLAHETLIDLWAGQLDDAEAARVETHVFECDACAAACERVGAVVAALRELIPAALSRAHVARLQRGGAKLLFTEVQPGVDARARFAPELDLLVHVLHASLADADRVDLLCTSADGAQVLARFEHVAFDRQAGEVLVACQRHYRHMFSDEAKFRLVAFEQGRERVVGEYVVEHVWP